MQTINSLDATSDLNTECIHELMTAACSFCRPRAGSIDLDATGSGNGPSRERSHADDKQAILNTITATLGLPTATLSTGSTEKRATLDQIAATLGISTDAATKPAQARVIVEALGGTWTALCDSTDAISGGGGTVTAAGMAAVRDAVLATVAAQAADDNEVVLVAREIVAAAHERV